MTRFLTSLAARWLRRPRQTDRQQMLCKAAAMARRQGKHEQAAWLEGRANV